jgi:hypothetical protein
MPTDESLTVKPGSHKTGFYKSEESRQRALANLHAPWPKGVSANPGGKPKKVTNALDRAVNRHNARRIAYGLVGSAAAGNVQAFVAIRETLEGKLPQPLTGEDGGPIQISLRLTLARERLAQLASDDEQQP